MKRTVFAALALVLAVGVVAAPHAEAGLFKKNKSKRTEKPEWMRQPRRFDKMPEMSFTSGIIQQDGWTGWRVEETKIQFAKDCVITRDGLETTSLDAGSEVVVMGPRVGDTIVAWSVRIQKPDFMTGRNISSETKLKVSEVNPNVGEIVSGPR